MSSPALKRLRRLVSNHYQVLRQHVAHRLGGASDKAGDALHDAYVRLAQLPNLEHIQHTQSYVVNTAVYVAIDQIRREARQLHQEGAEHLEQLTDELADPARQFEARQRLELMQAVLSRLPERQRSVLIEARVHKVSRAELARRWNISEAMVGREIRAAHLYCMRELRALESQSEDDHD